MSTQAANLLMYVWLLPQLAYASSPQQAARVSAGFASQASVLPALPCAALLVSCPKSVCSGGPGYDPGMAAPHQQSMQQQHGGMQRNGGQPGAGEHAYPGVSTRGLADIGYGEQATVLESETQQQNHYLDEISKGLDQLKFGAQVRAA